MVQLASMQDPRDWARGALVQIHVVLSRVQGLVGRTWRVHCILGELVVARWWFGNGCGTYGAGWGVGEG